MSKIFIGAGGCGKGGGSQRAQVEDADSLRSRAYARVVDLISEGQVKGLVNGLNSIYLDDVALQNSDGTFNFQDVAVDFKDGSIGQSALTTVEGSESSQAVNVPLKYGIPAVRTITAPETDICRVVIAVGQLTKTDTSNGMSMAHPLVI